MPNRNLSDYDYGKFVALQEMQGVKYLYINDLPGVVGTVNHRYGAEITDEIVSGIKDGVLLHFFGDVEPDWKTKEQYEWWQNLNKDSFKKTNRGFEFVSPPKIKGIKLPK